MEKLAVRSIPQMQDFMVPTTPDELAEIIALMPKDMRPRWCAPSGASAIEAAHENS